MDTLAAPVAVPERTPARRPLPVSGSHAVALALVGICAAAAAVRFASLGVQGYHHDEVITAMRVIPGSFEHMLHQVRVSESNPPLYYILAWGWAKAFGSGETALRSLSALLGLGVVPVGYLIGRQLASRRAGLFLAAFLAVNPMLIWYSQEARSYSLLVLCCALSFLFFLRARAAGRAVDLALWALFSALALCSHYFAVFPLAIEAVWLLLALRRRLRALLPALVAVGLAGAALLPLIAAQVNPTHIGWIENSLLSTRFFETGVSFLIGETGHVIAEPPRERYALLPAFAVAAALVLLVGGGRRERRGAAVAAVVGLGVGALAGLAVVFGKDYVVERNLLPALVPLAAVVAVGCAAARPRLLGVLLAAVLCAYWVAFDVYVTQTPNLQRPDFRWIARALGPAQVPRAVVSWKLAADPLRWYLPGKAPRMYGGSEILGEVDVVSKPVVAPGAVNLPPSFRAVERL
ncbi:MAG TPA: glycosyltransferase family 39 protein, partial [Solirubrobacterales bacterium]|nr:glycosyltransferase family 39 protein [Solirubrobacterales bacterium]